MNQTNKTTMRGNTMNIQELEVYRAELWNMIQAIEAERAKRQEEEGIDFEDKERKDLIRVAIVGSDLLEAVEDVIRRKRNESLGTIAPRRF